MKLKDFFSSTLPRVRKRKAKDAQVTANHSLVSNRFSYLDDKQNNLNHISEQTVNKTSSSTVLPDILDTRKLFIETDNANQNCIDVHINSIRLEHFRPATSEICGGSIDDSDDTSPLSESASDLNSWCCCEELKRESEDELIKELPSNQRYILDQFKRDLFSQNWYSTSSLDSSYSSLPRTRTRIRTNPWLPSPSISPTSPTCPSLPNWRTPVKSMARPVLGHSRYVYDGKWENLSYESCSDVSCCESTSDSIQSAPIVLQTSDDAIWDQQATPVVNRRGVAISMLHLQDNNDGSDDTLCEESGQEMSTGDRNNPSPPSSVDSVFESSHKHRSCRSSLCSNDSALESASDLMTLSNESSMTSPGASTATLSDKVARLRQQKQAVDNKVREAQREEQARRLAALSRKQSMADTLQQLRARLSQQAAALQRSYSSVLDIHCSTIIRRDPKQQLATFKKLIAPRHSVSKP